MLSNQQSLNLSPYSVIYDLVVPKDNMLRRINDLVDFSFVYDELKGKYCQDNGRNAINPIRMFKYLLLKTTYNLSDVDLVERSKYDMSFKYFLDMAPEDDVIDSSSLTKFRKLRLLDVNLLDLLINKTVEIAIEKEIIHSRSIIVDATHTKARYNQMSPQEILRQQAKLVRKSVYEIDEKMKQRFPNKITSNELSEEMDYCEQLIKVVESDTVISKYPKVREKVNLLKESLNDHIEELQLSNEPDARIGHKTADSSFFGFKTHLAMSEERIITAAVITTGEKNDGKQLHTLIEKSEKAGLNVDTIIGDTAYSEKQNIIYSNEKNIRLVSRLHPIITQGTRKEEEKFDFNKDAGMFVCKAGHMATKMTRHTRTRESKSTRYKYYFDIEKCKKCPFKDGCYKEGAKTKTYSITTKTVEHKEQEKFQESEYFKEKSRQRYKIEAKNSELKHRHGYDVAYSSGLIGMQMQGAMSIFTVNLKRILKLVD